MNGRVYDPMLGMFLSPDNYVQMPDFTQNFNRYSYASYALNNPLVYIDPSGYKFKLWKALLFAPFGLAAISPGTKYASGEASLGQAVGEYFINGASFIAGAGVGGAVTQIVGIGGAIGGTLSGAAGGFSSGFISGICNSLVYGNSLYEAYGKGLGHGMIGGITGGVLGGVSEGVAAKMDNIYDRNFWTGKIKGIKPSAYALDPSITNFIPEEESRGYGLLGKGEIQEPTSLKYHSERTFLFDQTHMLGHGNYIIKSGNYVQIEVTNQNVIGLDITIADHTTYYETFFRRRYIGESFDLIIPIGQTKHVNFYRFVEDPYQWVFNVSTRSTSAFANLKFFSTWVP